MRDSFMLEACLNQGAGLQHMAALHEPRILAMASHGNQQGELPLLWSLSTTLVELGYSVIVLDAHTQESLHNPGLIQLLKDRCWPSEVFQESDAWSVMPAAQGLGWLGTPGSTLDSPLTPLTGLLDQFGVILLYARADLLGRLLTGSGIEPLLSVCPLKMSSVTAYQAIKQMLLKAGLRSTVADIVMDPSAPSGIQGASPAHKLQECAMEFLGCQIDALTIRAGQSEDKIADDIHRLTLRLLEKAVPLRHTYAERSH